MSNALSFAEISGQHVELLPARTVLSVIDKLLGGDASTEAKGGENHADQYATNVKGDVNQYQYVEQSADADSGDAKGGGNLLDVELGD